MFPSFMHVHRAKRLPNIVRTQSGIIDSRKAGPVFHNVARAASDTSDDLDDPLGGTPEIRGKLWDIRDKWCKTCPHSLGRDYIVNVSESINGAVKAQVL